MLFSWGVGRKISQWCPFFLNFFVRLYTYVLVYELHAFPILFAFHPSAFFVHRCTRKSKPLSLYIYDTPLRTLAPYVRHDDKNTFPRLSSNQQSFSHRKNSKRHATRRHKFEINSSVASPLLYIHREKLLIRPFHHALHPSASRHETHSL